MPQRFAMPVAIVALLVAAAVATGGLCAERDRVAVPARIANHYDHKAFQPRRNDVCTRRNGQGLDCDSAAGSRAAAQLDRIRHEIDAIDTLYPPGFLSSASTRPP